MTESPTIISYLSRNARCIPTHTAVSDVRQTLTYEDLWEKSLALGTWLNAHGFSNGERILVEATPSVSLALSAMGIYLAGCVFVPVEKKISAAVIARFSEETSARLLIGDCEADGVTRLPPAELMELTKNGRGLEAHVTSTASNRIADILYTTGTTGKSKGVLLPHTTVLASAENSSSLDDIDGKAVYLIASPLNHTSALRKMYACLMAGAHAVLLDGFMDVKRFYDTIEAYRVTHLLLPPSAVRFLLAVSKEKLHSLQEQIKVVHSNGSAMTETDKEALRQYLPASKLIHGYGATEAGSVCTAYDYAKFPGMANCVGKPTPHAKILIVDEHHHQICSSKDHGGFIAISGDSVMEGYVNAPHLTAEVLEDNWLFTNDCGYIDQDGFVFVTGRKGDIINCGGMKVAPADVENATMKFPGIQDCACFGIPDSLTGMAVKLNVVPDKKTTLDLKAFRQFLKDQLESHQLPAKIECVPDIPKTPNGKIDRKKLQRENLQL